MKTINEIKTVIQYILISFREQDGTLLQTNRQMIGEAVRFPYTPITIYEDGTTTNYHYLVGWINEAGELVSGTVPNINQTYYAKRIPVLMPKEAQMLMVGEGESNQSMSRPFYLRAPFPLYLKASPYLTYLVRPLCTQQMRPLSSLKSPIMVITLEKQEP